MDVLTDVLSTLRLASRLYYRSELGAPWGLSMEAVEDMIFHVVDRGNCWLRIAGDPQVVPLTGGDLVVLPFGDAHQLVDDRATFDLPLRVMRSEGAGCPRLQFGGDGPRTTIVCGTFHFDHGDGPPLRDRFPRLIHLHSQAGSTHGWLQPTLQQLTAEAGADQPGAELVQRRLTDILFVQVVRAWMAEQPSGPPNWLGALRDPAIGAALGAIHRRPGAPWTVEALAEVAAMSRAVFSARFRDLVGQPPLHYVTAWRMQLAASALRQGDAAIRDLAIQLGYASEAAFSKAFKHWAGIGPGAYRKQRQVFT